MPRARVLPAHSTRVERLSPKDEDSTFEINGAALGDADYIYDGSFELAIGVLTRLEVRLGKARMTEVFPSGQSVTVDVYNPAIAQRFESIAYVSFDLPRGSAASLPLAPEEVNNRSQGKDAGAKV